MLVEIIGYDISSGVSVGGFWVGAQDSEAGGPGFGGGGGDMSVNSFFRRRRRFYKGVEPGSIKVVSIGSASGGLLLEMVFPVVSCVESKRVDQAVKIVRMLRSKNVYPRIGTCNALIELVVRTKG